MENIEHLHKIDYLDNIERMEKPFDQQLSRMSKNQLLILRAMLVRTDTIMTTRELARKTGIVEKQLGGVLSALSRKQVQDEHLIEAMGRDGGYGLRWRLNSKAITQVLAVNKVKLLILSYN